jgi:hypothetical protein
VKTIFHPLAVGLATVLVGGCTGVNPPDAIGHKSVESELAQMELDWENAIVRRDAAVLRRIIADDWLETSWDGTSFGKAHAIADLSAGTGESVVMDPIKVRVFGDMAIVTTGDTERSADIVDNGMAHYIWTDVYLKRNGQWQVVSTQGSRVPPPKP